MVELARVHTDVVGSLLRPEYLKEAYQQHDSGALDDAGLRTVQDRAARELIALQEGIGLDVVTDGECRRLMFEESFANSVEGVARPQDSLERQERETAAGRPLARSQMRSEGEATVERIRLVRNQPLEEYRFASQVAQRPVR
jgi:5-methyltetrahydropteroyltriglutamate--homocysteine methyltransferase